MKTERDYIDIEARKRAEYEKYEAEMRKQNGGSGKIRNPMKHLIPKKKKRKK